MFIKTTQADQVSYTITNFLYKLLGTVLAFFLIYAALNNTIEKHWILKAVVSFLAVLVLLGVWLTEEKSVKAIIINLKGKNLEIVGRRKKGLWSLENSVLALELRIRGKYVYPEYLIIMKIKSTVKSVF